MRTLALTTTLFALSLTGCPESSDDDTATQDDDTSAPGDDCGRLDTWGWFGVELNQNGGSAQGIYADGVNPHLLLPHTEEGDCVFYRYEANHCEPPCESPETCAFDDTCRSEPAWLNVGTVTFTGTDPVLTLTPTEHNTYYTTEVYPDLYEPGGTLTIEATGGASAGPFDLDVRGTSILSPLDQTFTMVEGEPLVITWDAPGSPLEGRVRIHLDNDHHGISAYAECDTLASAGSVTVPATIVDLMVQAGHSGIGTYVENATIQRYTETTRRHDPGCVSFATTSSDWLHVETVLAD